jgi:tetratricopeptide (TPR) repeat protein
MSAWVGTHNSVRRIAGCTSRRHKIGLGRALSGSENILVAAALLLGVPSHAAAQQSSAKASSSQPSSTTSATLQQAEALMQQGRLNEAKVKVQEELSQRPSSVEGYNLLGIIASGQKDYAGGEAAFQQALKVAPNSIKTHVNLGNVYVAEKKFDLAEKEFRTVLRTDPASRDANYNLGVLLMAKGGAAEAIPHFQRVRPSTLATQFNLVQAYLQTKATAQALQLAAELSAENKDDLQLHFSLGSMLASEKQYKAAELELEKADALRPGTFEILYNLGQAYYRSGEKEKAELAMDRALKLKSDSPEALYLQAQVYEAESRPLDALDLLVRAHKITPQNTDIIFLMAKISISQNYFEDAIPLLEAGLALAPQRTDFMAALGESYFMSGKVDKSTAVFKKLIEIEPSGRTYAYLGLSYLNLGRFDEAKQYLQQGLKLDPHNSSCLFNLGLIAEKQGDTATADKLFQEVLKYNPDYSDALLELANLRVVQKRLPEAAELLRRFVQVSHNPATGYYKLAMVERNLHQAAAADRDLTVFQTLSKNAPTGAYPYEHLFDYLDTRSKLAPGARDQLDITELSNEIKRHPDQPEDLYLLAEANLKVGKLDEAQSAIVQLDKLSAGDYRTLTGVGVLLARYHLYDEAIQHFQAALQANPDSDEVKFDLADAYFRRRQYSQALDTAGQVSEKGRQDDAYLALLGDIYAHLGDVTRAEEIYRDAISRNPDNDQGYLALALLQFRQNNVAGAKETLLKGQARVPGSGKILWGLGIASVLEGNTAQAADQFERAMDILPEWPGSYSTLGVFYFETGQIDKAKEVLDRFKNSNVAGGLDVNKIEQVLNQAPATAPTGNQPMTMANREQLLQLALSLADRTL